MVVQLVREGPEWRGKVLPEALWCAVPVASGGVKQFNPEKELVLDEKDVAAIHLVLKNHELMGV